MTNDPIDPATARRAKYVEIFQSQLAKMTPSVPGGRFSGQQIAYAKGVAAKGALK